LVVAGTLPMRAVMAVVPLATADIWSLPPGVRMRERNRRQLLQGARAAPAAKSLRGPIPATQIVPLMLRKRRGGGPGASFALAMARV